MTDPLRTRMTPRISPDEPAEEPRVLAIPYERRSTARDVTSPALLAALLAASAWIAIPAGAVPVTLQVFVVFVAGLVLRPMRAGLAVLAYLLLGAAGAPVFSAGQGGLGVLMGPTGGFLYGFLAAVLVIAEVRSTFAGRAPDTAIDAVAVALGLVAIYAWGWLQLTVVTGMGPAAAFVAGVAPFVAIDALKGVAAVAVAAALRRSGLAAS